MPVTVTTMAVVKEAVVVGASKVRIWTLVADYRFAIQLLYFGQ